MFMRGVADIEDQMWDLLHLLLAQALDEGGDPQRLLEAAQLTNFTEVTSCRLRSDVERLLSPTESPASGSSQGGQAENKPNDGGEGELQAPTRESGDSSAEATCVRPRRTLPMEPHKYATAVLQLLNQSAPLPRHDRVTSPVLTIFQFPIVPYHATVEPEILADSLKQGLEYDLREAGLSGDAVTCIWSFVGVEERTYGSERQPTYVFELNVWEEDPAT